MSSATLRFLGAARNVTGSCYLLEIGGSRLLVDCGLYQERELRERNWADFPLPPESIDAVLLTHAHLDHCGLLPRLVRGGFRGRIYCTPATADIAPVVLLDSARIQEEDAETKRLRHRKEGRPPAGGPGGPRHPEQPLYTEEDVKDALALVHRTGYRQALELGDGLQARFLEAGHVLGSASIRLEGRWNGGARSLLFSGDIGRWNRPIIEDPFPAQEADYMLMESTYGDRSHEATDRIESQLAEAVSSTAAAGGNLIVPSFALERTQELMYYLSRLRREKRIPEVPVFIDSPMAVSLTEIFKAHPELFDREMNERIQQGRSPFDFPGLHMARSVEESKAINRLRGTAVIIAGSGMCTGGRVKHHLAHNIGRPESTILFVGYQARGTLGRELLDGAVEVRIFGERRCRRARVLRISGFSAHADQGELLRWLSALKAAPRRMFLTHGEPGAIDALSTALHEKLGWKAESPVYGQQVELT